MGRRPADTFHIGLITSPVAAAIEHTSRGQTRYSNATIPLC